MGEEEIPGIGSRRMADSERDGTEIQATGMESFSGFPLGFNRLRFTHAIGWKGEGSIHL
jgi:hypothetical protein